MKILVTGASGLLGANLCRHLVEHELGEVRALVRRPLNHPLLDRLPIEQVSGSLTDPDSLKQAASGCQRVFHVAGKVSYDRRDLGAMQQVNVIGTQNILRASADEGVQRVVVTSSTAAVGLGKCGDVPLNEASPFLKSYQHVPYMATKRAAEDYALAFTETEVVAVNPATIYGAGDVYLNTGELFVKIKGGRLKFYPPGGMSVVSAADAVKGHCLAMEQGVPGQRYILATADHSFLQIFNAIADTLSVKPPTGGLPAWLHGPLRLGSGLIDTLLGWTGKVPTLRPVIDIGFACRYFDSSKARRELGWQPTDDLSAMLKEAAEFYREHIPEF